MLLKNSATNAILKAYLYLSITLQVKYSNLNLDAFIDMAQVVHGDFGDAFSYVNVSREFITHEYHHIIFITH